MQYYHSIKRNEAQFLAITGFKLSTFNELMNYFEPCWDEYISHFTVNGKVRKRFKIYRKDSIFPDTESMLVFILSFMKNNPLQQAHAFSFKMSQPQANLWIHLLKKTLNSSLDKSHSLPCRDLDSLNKLLNEGQDILIDGSERPIPRPGDYEVQKEFYSGKSHMHAVKNLIICNISKFILFLSDTCEGRIHDLKISDLENYEFRKKVIAWIDLGFIGLNPENVKIELHKKKPKGKELTEDEKNENKRISRTRVIVEHAIGCCKVFRIVKEEIRAFKDNFRDLVMFLACGLSNFKLIHS